MIARVAGMAFLLAALLLAGPAMAVEPEEILENPALEERARNLSAQLRCLVCQNQSIDDSNAALAKDLRILVRERLVAGDTDEQVLDFVVARYGSFVLLKPPLDASTYLLWFTPFLLAAGVAIVVIGKLAKKSPAASRTLSPEEEGELARILKEGE
jgi:cytochrome c-type biogenesis protein CcmH